MEDLTKQQMVLLTLLTSFVTSIATGIITVALLREAPPDVPSSVNRIIEKTIERVVPDQSKNANQPKIETVTKEVTVTVKEDDLLTSAVEKNIGKIAKIFPEGVASTTKSLGVATLLSKDGVLVTERVSLLVDGAYLPKYILVFPDGTTGDAEILGKDSYKDHNPEPIAYLKLEAKDIPPPVIWTNATDLKLGQTVALVGGGEGDEVLKASVSRVKKETSGEGTSSVTSIVYAESNPTPGNLYRSAAVFNLDGYIMGIVERRGEDGIVILPIKRVFDILTDIQKATEKPADGAGGKPGSPATLPQPETQVAAPAGA